MKRQTGRASVERSVLTRRVGDEEAQEVRNSCSCHYTLRAPPAKNISACARVYVRSTYVTRIRLARAHTT